MPDTYLSKLGECQLELRNKLNNGKVYVDLERDKVRVLIYEPVTGHFSCKRFKYYSNWKEAYNLKEWCDNMVLMHTFGVTEQ